jgi:hypothetical protein
LCTAWHAIVEEVIVGLQQGRWRTALRQAHRHHRRRAGSRRRELTGCMNGGRVSATIAT